ncbi:armadillo-type protein [Cadophora sp. MPI-SDFR-AT-0126]|nr:armadillo-type protein [Leotiomycetes sp. MPI-SDFR-AT-0126]
MDAPEVEQDVQLERSAPNLLADLGQSLQPFLRRDGQIRRTVMSSDTDRLVNLLEPFQELPQLLDPHLNKFVPILANAFLDYLRAPPSKQPTTHLLIPLSKAVCRLLYTFCKIRGEKVIVQFFGTETRVLELLLSAIEKDTSWWWEERYITLLWLSQLLLVPFDLASISSQGTEDIVELDISGFSCPANVPALSVRVISLAVSYLSSSGKERDAAKTLLVRVAMRPDMQQVGVLRALVKWAIYCLHPSVGLESSPYFYIGILSFLAGMLVSSDGTPDMVEYLQEIFDVTRDQDGMPNAILDAIRQSAVSRKIMIKIFRAIALLDLANSADLDRVQTVIGDLLDFLEDEATPVRLAASKALSIITLKLDPDMASQVVDVVLDTFTSTYRMLGRPGKKTADLSDVKPFQWHGLVLTFSHLLYRRSIPPSSLAPVLGALRLALSFEKRSATSATSTGTNVRDAANFGIWALARRYTSAELQAIRLDLDGVIVPAVQILAPDLVVAASLDPAGNVRRGSSAALQELIGRNPDTIAEGIQVVQVVDYHAIALRSRAVQEVAVGAAALSNEYHQGLLDALLGWRGVRDSDATARRNAASAIGMLVWAKRLRSSQPWDEFRSILDSVAERLKALVLRDGDERHGLLLCSSSIIEPFTQECLQESSLSDELQTTVSKVLSVVVGCLKYVNGSWSTLRNQSLIAEAICKLSMASNPLLLMEHSQTHTRDQTVSLQTAVHEKFMTIEDPVSVGVISDAAVDMITLMQEEDIIVVVDNYIQKAKTFSKSRRASKNGACLHTLIKVFPVIPSRRTAIIGTIQEIWSQDQGPDSRALILRCLGPSALIQSNLNDVISLVEEGLDDFTTNAQGDVGSKVRIEAAKAVAAIWSDSNPERQYIRERLCGKVMRTASEKLDKVRREGQKCLLLDPSDEPKDVSSLEPSSKLYFLALLNVQVVQWWATSPHASKWSEIFMSGYITSADTGASALVQASRLALLTFCEASPSNTNLVSNTLLALLTPTSTPNDRILVSALETVSFLLDMQILQRSTIDWKTLYFRVQKAHYQSANLRKIEACVKIYGGLMDAGLVSEARGKLVGMLLHNFPGVRNAVVDELWAREGKSVLKSVDWTKAKTEDLERVKGA